MRTATRFPRLPLWLTSCVTALMLSACASPPLAPPLQGEYALLLAAGDIADCRYVPAEDSGAQQTALVIEEEIRRTPAARVLTLGDNTYPVGLPAEFARCFHPTWGRFKQRILPMAGNHEYYTKGAPGYYGYFGSQAGPAGKGYYATTLGSWRVIVLNSALRGAAFAEQLNWLQEELQQHRTRCTLAAAHHPTFTSGGHGNNAFMLPVWQILSDAGVDLVLAGHDHHYERFRPMDRNGQPSAEGMTSFIVGTGGAQFSPLWLPRAATAGRDNSVHGVLRLELHQDAFAWRFLPTQSTPFADAGQGHCR